MRPITSLKTRLAAVVIAVASAASLVAAGSAAAAPPSELNLDGLTAVNTRDFTSYAYRDDGTTFFRYGGFLCRMGPRPGSIGCQGKPATAPPGTIGVAITQDSQGPWWVQSNVAGIHGLGTTYKFGPNTNYRPRSLKVGQKISIANASCGIPRAGVIACTTPNRAFIVSRKWHKFYGAPRLRDKNPPAKYLPPALR